MSENNKEKKLNPARLEEEVKELEKKEGVKPTGNKKKKSKGSTSWLKYGLYGLALLVIIAGIYFLFFYQAPIEVSTNQDRAAVKVDGRAVEKEKTAVKPGNHQLTISAPGYVDFEKQIYVDYFFNETLKIDLKKEPQLTTLDKGDMDYLSYDEEKNNLFYLKGNACWRINFNKDNPKPERISRAIFKNIDHLVWTKDHQGAIIQVDYPRQLKGTILYKNTGNTVTWFYDFRRYDLQNQRTYYWGKGIGGYDLAPSGQEVTYYLSTLSSERSLANSNLKKTNDRRLARIGDFVDPYISWQPNKEYILILNQEQITIYDSYENTFSKIADKGNFNSAQVAPNGEKIIYLTNSPDFYKPVSMMSIAGKEKKNLNFNTRLHNINWLTQTSFCAAGGLNDKAELFCFDIKGDPQKDIVKLAYKGDPPLNIKGFQINQNDNQIYLIDKDKLIKLNIVYKEY